MEKTRLKPYQLLCYEALFRRLKPAYHNNKSIYDDYMNYVAGYFGEKNVDYVLSISSLQNALIYRDIRLQNKSHTIQIDTLIVTPTFLLIIEIKNLTGELEYDQQHDQLIQIIGDQKKRMRNPVLQASTQKMHLEAWLQMFNLPFIPIETLSVISNSNAILTAGTTATMPERLIHAEAFPLKYKRIASNYQNALYSTKTRQRLNKRIIEGNKPYHPDIIKKYNLKNKHLIRGVACSSCNHRMKRLREKWMCKKCQTADKLAHQQVIYDYFLLYKNTITNRECRDLLQIENAHTAQTLLKSMNLRKKGFKRGTFYLAPSLINFPQQTKIPIET